MAMTDKERLEELAVSSLLERLAKARRETPKLLYDGIVNKERHIQECLKNIKIQLESIGDTSGDDTVTKAAYILQNRYETSDADLHLTYLRAYEQIQLLTILAKMKASSICRIINEI